MRIVRSVAALVAAAVLSAACDTGGGASGQATDAPDATAGDDAATDGDAAGDPELADYCRIQLEMDRRAGEDYLGSDEHVAALDDLVDAAPSQVRDDVAVIRDHIDAEVSPDDRASHDVGSYPQQVREAIGRVDEHTAEVCGPGPPPDA